MVGGLEAEGFAAVAAQRKAIAIVNIVRVIATVEYLFGLRQL
jgi:hypothetical protein